MNRRTTTSRHPLRVALVALAGAAALVLSACASSTDGAGAETTGAQSTSSSETSSTSPAGPEESSSESADAGSESPAASSEETDSTATDPASLLPADLAAKGTIVVGSNIEYPPFEMYDDDNITVLGLDRDVADGLEKQLGVTLEFQNAAFDALIPGLVSGRYDMAMSAMTDTEEREKQVDFVDYVKAGGGIMVPADNPHAITLPGDLCGLKVAIVKGTTEVDDADFQSAECEKEGKKALDSAIYPGNNQMILALQSGRADVALIDSVSGEQIASESEGKLAMLPPYNESYFGIVFPKGSDQLQKAVQAALEAMAADGSYQAIFEKWGLGGAVVDAFTINGAITEAGGLGG